LPQDYPNARTRYLYDPECCSYEGVLADFHESLQRLGVGYVDLVLLHWPGMFDFPDRFQPDFRFTMPSKEAARSKRLDMWRALEALHAQGLVRAIGVSNFTDDHLRHLLDHCSIKPVMNQLEVHPYHQQPKLLSFCEDNGITVTAFSPLGGGEINVLGDPEIVRRARAHGVSPAQFVLAWHICRGIVVVPRFETMKEALQNLFAASCTLTEEDMTAMAALDRGLRIRADPSLIP